MSFKFDPALLERRAIKVEVDSRYRAPENLLAAASRKKSHMSALEDKPKVPRPRPESNGERKPRSSSSNSNSSNDKGYKSTSNGIDKRPTTPSTPIIDKSNPIWNIPLKKKDIPIDEDDEEDEKDKKKKFIKDIKPTITSTTVNRSNISTKSTTTTTSTSLPKSTSTTASTSSSASSNLAASNKNKTGSSSTSTNKSTSAPRPKTTTTASPKPVERKPALAIQNTPAKTNYATNIQPGIGIMSMGNSGNTYMRKESYLDKYSSSSSSTSQAAKNILGATNTKLTIPEKKQGPTIVNTSLATATGAGLKYSANHSLNNGKTASQNKSTTSKRKSYSDDEDEEDLFGDSYLKKSIKSNSGSSPHSNKVTDRSSNNSNGRSSTSSYGFSLNSGGSSNNKKSGRINNSKYSDEEESYEDEDDEYENDSFIDDNSEDDEVSNFMSKIRDKRRGRYDDRNFDDRSMITRADELEMEERKSARLAREEERREEERERRIKEEKERRKQEYEKSRRK